MMYAANETHAVRFAKYARACRRSAAQWLKDFGNCKSYRRDQRMAREYEAAVRRFADELICSMERVV